MSKAFDTSQVMEGLQIYNEKVSLAVKMYAETVAKDFESYAKENRPWTDRTGQARQRLTGYSESIDKGERVYIAHGVDYGMWLEYCHEKRFAILEPTVRLKSQEAIQGMETLLKKVKVF